MKQKILSWYNVFLQKHEGPTLVGKTSNPMYKDLFREQLDEIREGRANITVGIEDDVSVLESAHRGEGFKEAINYHDTMIYRKMNIGTMILGQENGAGAYAQSHPQSNSYQLIPLSLPVTQQRYPRGFHQGIYLTYQTVSVIVHMHQHHSPVQGS